MECFQGVSVAIKKLSGEGPASKIRFMRGAIHTGRG
jgi:hypothetical protein